ncbi:MAG TPA: flagellin [Bryobacteraceae bacterium]|jgi:flagellin
MPLSIQTNVASLEAQNSIRINSNFQNNTIEQLSSGYRINNSGDDAAGLATANQYAGTIATLTQGVLNANNASSTLQIADGGISNISTILSRLQTLATESASSTFAGNRSTVNTEYQGLLAEINRQASSINLNTGGLYNTNLITYVGGGDNQIDSQVAVDLSGASNAVDSTALGIQATSVAGGGTELTNNIIDLNNTATSFISGNAAATQTFNLNIATATGSTPVNVVVDGSVAGITGADVVSQLNTALAQYGISASIANDGRLEFGGSTAFTVTAGAIGGGGAAGSVAATANSTAINTSNYNIDSSTALNGAAVAGGAFAGFTTGSETVTFQNGNGSTSVVLGSAAANPNNAVDLATTLQTLNGALSGTGISAISNAGGNGISFQSTSSFNIDVTANTTGLVGNLFGSAAASAANSIAGAVAITGPSTTASDTGNAIAALSALNTAIANLGLTQGIVGAGENKLNYAINLAQSQITNYSAAESGIKDADVAQEAANLTKAQVLEQASLAALAQANSAPQAVLTLLK